MKRRKIPPAPPSSAFVSTADEWDDDVDQSPAPPPTKPVFSNEGLKRAVTHSMTDDQFSGMLTAAHRGAKMPPDNRKGDRGALALRITQLMKDNPTVTRTADILALLGPIKGKDGKPMTKERLRKAVNRARP